ncbi:MAG: sensor domain-containing diguanylate cyclase, partial [Micromonosporaceae bacterium]|nr:sensor domain-containing diguanylate cyclase [Micromonosporaceae bacterium]
MVLLRSDEEDPSTMVWLGRTGAPAGCLGLWADGDLSPGDALRIVGVHGSPLDRLRDTRVPVDRFPPEPLLARADASTGQIVYAVPVAVAGSHWGMLAAVGTVDTHSSNGGSEAFNHLGGLLAVALEQLRQRSNLISGYQRERELAEELRRSEERYALSARASNDGLWDWDLTSDTIFYSDRWIMTIGHRPGELGPSPKEWLSRVHADDRDALDKAVAACRSGDTLLLEHGHRIRMGTGSYRWMLCRALAVHDAEGNAARLVGSLTDIDDQRKLEEHLRYAASYDSLTGLSNRRHFLERLDAAVAAAAASGQEFAVLYCDLDGFKAVNDWLGHLVGDQLLIGVADRISSSIRATDLGARLGGDEFAVLLTAVTPGELEQVTSRLQQAIAEPFVLEGHTVTVGVSIGTSFGDAGPAAASEVLRQADAAMYQAKQARRRDASAASAGTAGADAATSSALRPRRPGVPGAGLRPPGSRATA